MWCSRMCEELMKPAVEWKKLGRNSLLPEGEDGRLVAALSLHGRGRSRR